MELEKILNLGGVVVMPTDTIYGVLGQALNKQTVQRIYQIKERPPEKPFIILISNFEQLKLFGIEINSYQKELMKKLWPGKVSVVLEGVKEDFIYLTRNTNSLAFRMPKDIILQRLIEKVGPLVAPSANLSGHMPAKDINTAKKYFGDKVDYYLDGGFTDDVPSTLILLKKESYKVIRSGAVDISKIK